MLGFEITVKHQNQGLQQRCNHHHRRCGRRDHRARLAGKTAPAASKGKLPPVMASPKSLRGEKKMNPALFVDSIEVERYRDVSFECALLETIFILLFFVQKVSPLFQNSKQPSLSKPIVYKQTTPRRRRTRSRSIKCQKT